MAPLTITQMAVCSQPVRCRFRNPFAGRRVHAVEQLAARVGVPDFIGRHLMAAMRAFDKNEFVGSKGWYRKAVAACGADTDTAVRIGPAGFCGSG